MAKNVFLSFKYDEKNWKDNVLPFFQGKATPVYISEGDGPKEKTQATIEQYITDKLTSCVGLLVVIGDKSQHSPWAHYEIREAIRLGKKCAGTKHPQAAGNGPEGYKNLQQLEWDTTEIADWIASL